MGKKYVFLTNSVKPNNEQLNSMEDIVLNNVSKPCIEAAIKLGYEVILGVNRNYPEKLRCKEYPIHFYQANIYRNILNFKDNYKAYKNLNKILKKGDVEIIHCNSPIGGFIGRVCGKKYKIPCVIYTAHGFHFYKGAPLFNNTILKWIEFFLAHWTDVIITMNKEDFQSAKKMKLRKNGKIYKINGVGIKIKDYQNILIDKVKKRYELGLNKDDFVCIAMGDLIKRKNYKLAIKAISETKNIHIHYLICGNGPELDKLKNLSKELHIEKQIHFLGFRNDVKELLAISDCFLFTSLQEGLPRSLMEAMATGLPCLVSNIRGNNDLIKNSFFLIESVEDCKNKLLKLIANKELLTIAAEENKEEIKKYDEKVISDNILNIYNDLNV